MLSSGRALAAAAGWDFYVTNKELSGTEEEFL